MRAEDSLKANYGIDLHGGGMLLNTLEDSVSKALGMGSEGAGASKISEKNDAVPAEQVKSYMSGIAGVPLPGMLQYSIV